MVIVADTTSRIWDLLVGKIKCKFVKDRKNTMICQAYIKIMLLIGMVESIYNYYIRSGSLKNNLRLDLLVVSESRFYSEFVMPTSDFSRDTV
jgi:hypothetical protein